MKRLLVLVLIIIATSACKNQESTEDLNTTIATTATVEEDKNTFKGEFIFLADAAVLTTKSEIYAVRMDDKMKELNELAKPLKRTEFDMVNVILKGDVVPNPLKQETGEGWDEMVIIKEIVEVTPAKSAVLEVPAN